MKRKEKQQQQDNLLDLIPIRNEEQKWETTEDGLVQMIIPRDGIMDRIVRVFFKTPEVMKIDLDELGTCVWNTIDGKRDIEEIAEIVKAEFGENAEPLYERLGTYINILRNNKFITIEKGSN